ncbi:MAG: hypothetical protein CK424_03770 [Legionella sp.]|nr:MAG: hypothetical protein CK424_03770 [Legionella sp.]
MTYTKLLKLQIYTFLVCVLLSTYETYAEPQSDPSSFLFEQEKAQSLTFESYQLSNDARREISERIRNK